MFVTCPGCGGTCPEGRELCVACTPPPTPEKLVAQWECVITEQDGGDTVWCDAYLIDGDESDKEFWEIEVPGNKWTEGDVFYVLRSRRTLVITGRRPTIYHFERGSPPLPFITLLGRDMTVQELIDELSKENPDADVTFSVELPESEDPVERRFAEDGWQFVVNNGSQQFDRRDATVVTIGVLCDQSNLSAS